MSSNNTWGNPIVPGVLLELEDNPVDNAIAELIQLELIEGAYDCESGQLGVTLTPKGLKLVEDEELDNFVEGDEFQAFLKKAEKVLDKVR